MKGGRMGCAADPGADRGQPGARAHGGQTARIPAVLGRKPPGSWQAQRAPAGARGSRRWVPPTSPGHRLAKALSFLPGVHLQFPGGTWSILACRLFEYLSSVILRRCHSRREKAEPSSWGSWQLRVTCRFCDPPPARVSEGPLFSLDFLLLFV